MMRLIDSGICTPLESLALETTIFKARYLDMVPDTLHLYRRDRPTVSIGRFQSVDECLDTNQAKRRNMSLIRRMSGGSCIYTDENQLIYSIIMSTDNLPKARKEIFPFICNGVVQALSNMGILAEYKAINDVLVNGKKISGSAQIRKKGILMQHGTLIMHLDRESMDAVLRPIKERTYPGLTALDEYITLPEWGELKSIIASGFEKALNVTMVEENLSDWETDFLVAEMNRINADVSSSSL